MTELHGGVCHRTSTPHKSGNKMKEKKKKKEYYDIIHVVWLSVILRRVMVRTVYYFV